MKTIEIGLSAAQHGTAGLSVTAMRALRNQFSVLALSIALGAGATTPARAQEPIPIPLPTLAAAPTVDGELADWQGAAWQRIKIEPAEFATKNAKSTRAHPVGSMEVELTGGVHANNVYLAVRWPDAQQSSDYRPWRWQGKRYRRSKERDDQFAVRFFMDGDYDACMISEKNYKVDVWLWSAGRSNAIGHADDLSFLMTTDMIDNAAEYQNESGKTVYIKRFQDTGTELYETKKPGDKFVGKQVESVEMNKALSGSRADVAARGVWKDGYWHLEMKRQLDTGHADDVVLSANKDILGSIAVFNRSGAEDKSVSATLLFKL